MIRRLARDESGIAMGLAVVMIVLIGVMGAGLLVFVRNDLEAVVEVNQGQRALEAADAGVQAARRQLLSDATANSTTNIYDSNDANGNSPWSPLSRPGTPSGGRDLTFDTNAVNMRMNVRIQYLLPSDTPSELTDPDRAPELTPLKADGTRELDYPEPVDYFKITTEGTAGEARRKIEAIYVTKDLGVPKGYYTPGTVDIRGTARITGVSIFALGNVTINSNSSITGNDAGYGDWGSSPFNTTPRRDAAGNPVRLAGIGTPATINGTKVAGRDYDGNVASPSPANPKFIKKEPPKSSQTTSQISFPFDYALPDIDFLRDEAMKQEAETGQDHYREVSTSNGSVTTWPDPPAGGNPSRTVVFYKFTGANGSNNLKWNVGSSCAATPKEGTLVIENGDFTTTQNSTPFRGAVVVRGGQATDGESEDTGGNTCLQGFVNASGGVKIAGSVTPMSDEELAKRPGWYGAELWSWRECYTPTCS